MRKQYRDVVRSRLRDGGWSRVLDAGVKVLGQALPRTGQSAPGGPILGTVILSYACNYRCEFCELPQRSIRRRKQGWEEFDTEGWKSVLRGFAALRTSGVGFTGGEPFLRRDCLELLRYSLSLGLVTHVNTNASLLPDELLREVMAVGLDSVNVSLDGARAETHDRLRGRVGSFDAVTDRLRRMVGERDRVAARGGRRTRIGITTVLTPDNADQVEELADLAESLGVDSLGFIPMHEYHDGDELDEVIPERPWAARMQLAVERLETIRRERDILENSEAYLSLFPRCFAGRPSPLRCHAPETSLVIDCYGHVFPCVPLSEVDRPIGRVTGDELANFWKSRRYAEVRRELAGCRACYWNCHTELNLLWQSAPAGAIGAT